MIVGMALAVGAVDLDDGWTLAMDLANMGETNGWAVVVWRDAKPAPVPRVIQQGYPHSYVSTKGERVCPGQAPHLD